MTMEPKNIFTWLGMKQEEEIFKEAEKHIDITYETVVNFKNAVASYAKGDIAGRNGLIEKVKACERQADAIKTKVQEFLMESPLTPADREDLMYFIKTLDTIADWTNGSARLMAFLEQPLPKEIMDNIAASTEIIFEATSRLKDSIHAFIKNNFKLAVKNSYEVDNLESRADDQKQILIGIILRAKLDAPTLMLTYQLAEYLESVTDQIEDAADFLRILAIKAK